MRKALVLLISSQLFFSCDSEPKKETNNNIPAVEHNTNITSTEVKEEPSEVISIDTSFENNSSSETAKTDEILTNEQTSSTPNENIIEKSKQEESTLSLDSVIAKSSESDTKTEPKTVKVIFNHQKWDALVRKYVSASGKVNYKGFVSDKVKLDNYIKELQLEFANLNSWNKNRQLAYWINVYNAFTVKLIVDNYPTSSIKNINGGKPWNKKFINLGTQTYDLNQVENEIIRKRYNESRIHFAVNCAAKSCPKLMNRAFTESNLNSKLTEMTVSFLKDTKNNILTAKKVQVSKIFEWYKSDFTKNGDIIPYLRKYSDVEINDNAKVEYLEYNWDLNE